MPASFIKPAWEHASSRFMCVTHGVIDILQTYFFNGISLENAIPSIDGEKAAVIVAESLEADRVWNLPPEHLLDSYRQGPEGDFKSAVLAQILLETVDMADPKEDEESRRNLWAIAMASLEKIARSPTASPLLWYEDIYLELAQGAKRGALDESLYWHKCSLAYNLRYNAGDNGVQILHDIAETYLDKGELERGLQMLIALLHHAPDDIWTYNLMAISFNRFGLTQLGEQGIQRGLQLLNAKGDKEHLRRQLEEGMTDMRSAAQQGREADISPAVISDFQAALALDFNAHSPESVADLCRKLVPDVRFMKVKRPLKPADVPLPDPEHIYHLLSGLSRAIPKQEAQHARHKRRRKK